MSGGIDRKTDSQRSHLSSLTMRLKDKLHTPRVRRSVEHMRRTPSQRASKLPDLHLSNTHTPDSKSEGSVLVEQQRVVLNALCYFKTLVEKLGVGQQVVGGLLGGSAGEVLEAVATLLQLEPRIHSSKTVSVCLSGLYPSLAHLIRWADQVMLQGVAHDDKEAIAIITMEIRGLQDRVKELVKLTIERQEGPSPTSPGQSQEALGQHAVEQDKDKVPGEEREEESAPPKPPKPLPQPLPLLQTEAHSAPALPPKRCQLLSGPAPCRVAIVAPMRRETGFQKEESEEDYLKHRSSSSGDTHCFLGQDGDSDDDYLHKDFSSSWPPPLLSSSHSPPLFSSSSNCRPLLGPLVESPPPPSLPPALPEKKRRSIPGNSISQATPPNSAPGNSVSQAMPPDSAHGNSVSQAIPPDSAPGNSVSQATPPNPAPGNSVSQATPPNSAPMKQSPDNHLHGNLNLPSSPLSPSGTPPPLPEKKRHIQDYLQFMASYSAPSADLMFYQKTQNSSRFNSSKHRELETAFHLTHTHPDTHPDAHTHSTLPPVPTLPPKKRQLDQDSTVEDRLDRENTPQDCFQNDQQRAAFGERRSEEEEEEEEQEEEEEVLMINQQEILNRITMKQEEEEGPDVKAASPDILLVHATEIDSMDQMMFCEAFLSTYRTFFSPYDVITKLQYRQLNQRTDMVHRRASKNTFLLLARVVDELCAVELDADLQALLMDLVFSLLIGGELGLTRLLRPKIISKLEQRHQLIGYPLSLRPLSARGVSARPGTLLDFQSQHLAEQLTLIDAELFYKIELPEVLLWSKEQNEERSQNLTEFTQSFNNVSYWVRSVIILQERPQDREKLMLKFIKVMKHLRKLNNFNSYLAVLSALGSAPLSRLDWQRHTAEALEEYSSLIDSSSSFRAYRAALAEVEPPCIPYLGLILQDLTFVHLGNPDVLMTSQGSKVNFSKRWQQFNILETLRSYQQVRYSLQPNEEIISFFNDFSDHLAEEALWELSLRLRPRSSPRANQR